MRRLWGSGAHIRSSRSPSFCKIGALCRGESVAKIYHSFSTPVNSEPEACQFFHEDWFPCPLQPPPMNVFWTQASCAFHLSTHFHLVSIFQGFVDFDIVFYLKQFHGQKCRTTNCLRCSCYHGNRLLPMKYIIQQCYFFIYLCPPTQNTFLSVLKEGQSQANQDNFVKFQGNCMRLVSQDEHF